MSTNRIAEGESLPRPDARYPRPHGLRRLACSRNLCRIGCTKGGPVRGRVTMTSEPIRIAQRTHAFQYAVRDIVLVAREAQRAGKELLYLNIGDPGLFDFPLPEHLVEAISRALREQHASYAPSEGIPEALEAIREDAETRCRIRNIQDVFVGTGCSECIEVALAGLVDEGESVLTPHPGYPLYTALLAKLGCREVPYFLDESRDWQPDLADVERKIDEKTRALVIINPHNPTGSVCSRETLNGLLELAAKHDLVVLSDEIYDRLVLEGEAVPAASLRDDLPIITFNGLSKGYLGPGLRVGWAISSGPAARLAPYVEAMQKLLRARLCASHPAQYAIAPALRGDQSHITRAVAALRQRRDITVKQLNAMDGVSCVPPRAAFYAFPRLEREADDAAWVRDLVRETGVVTVQGAGFGQPPGTSHFRVVYLPPEPTLRRALGLIGDFVNERNRAG